jgi:alanine dehydrogenase
VSEITENRLLAAVDMGSNSFHMIVGRVDHGEIRTIERRSEKVQLASGLSEKGDITEEARLRALECLRRFSQRLQGIPGDSVRVVGTNALMMAVGLQARVTVIDKNLDRLRQLDQLYGNRIETAYSTQPAIEQALATADAVIGAVLLPGAAAPKLVTREMVQRMQPGTVLVDVAIDQGGCFETSKPTTHAEPTYLVNDVVHYCVANMPGAVARTSTLALNNATLPHALALANHGWRDAMKADRHLMNGLNVCQGKVTY